ncbi:hypothetical protein M6B22_19535 [Jatrophihabitans cynanchi]|uniref:Sulfocyanin-like C-terminal domain-containing protein n=1 Tax=Jatrophihabitans cynanchi TaxID=2944128 RepID=A0ABY7JZY4_9ACTN|nr:sulfocyanin-like copper-binding protein [Jatrophihabitans sp. SB3-54]WAX56699.1 hypothetical protein M6B22_19535 [Jatrophihabitans sp. SB3-54]
MITDLAVRRRDFALAAAAVVVLTAASTVSLGAAAGAFDHRSNTVAYTTCSSPALSGSVVHVSLVDMRGMGGGMMGGQGRWRSWHAGMMRIVASTASVGVGTVSLRVTNSGVLTHELVVLTLPAGATVGSRAVGADGKVDEAGSVGEVSNTCGAGAGPGLAPGSTGWTTLTLPAGRYELVCNLPGHYAAGMSTELDVG